MQTTSLVLLASDIEGISPAIKDQTLSFKLGRLLNDTGTPQQQSALRVADPGSSKHAPGKAEPAPNRLLNSPRAFSVRVFQTIAVDAANVKLSLAQVARTRHGVRRFGQRDWPSQ